MSDETRAFICALCEEAHSARAQGCCACLCHYTRTELEAEIRRLRDRI